ncbi:Dps family protein [Longispora albida]|uniref:Dps family protein n=1 Tax=Longispora albida TaxID=203523 RepID=UPI0003651A92|nr:DNA starvation/stationary phase protection protein [Longispora albida]
MANVRISTALSEDARKIAGEALQGALADLVDLSLVAKQAHWNVVGRSFRSVHLQLDEVVDSARLFSDQVAERAAAIGINPDGRASTVAKTSGVPEIALGWLPDTEVVGAFVASYTAVVQRMRQRIDATADADPVTQDIFIGITAELEKQAWMFQAEHAG